VEHAFIDWGEFILAPEFATTELVPMSVRKRQSGRPTEEVPGQLLWENESQFIPGLGYGV